VAAFLDSTASVTKKIENKTLAAMSLQGENQNVLADDSNLLNVFQETPAALLLPSGQNRTQLQQGLYLNQILNTPFYNGLINPSGGPPELGLDPAGSNQQNLLQDSGSNTYVDGGDRSDRRFTQRPLLEYFREPAEGILQGSKIILGIGANQIDGQNDFAKLKSGGQTQISRPQNGYPDLKIRKNILQRLSGTYRSVEDMMKTSDEHSVTSIYYKPSSASPFGVERIMYGHSQYKMILDSDAKFLILDIDAPENLGIMQGSTLVEAVYHTPGISMKWAIEISDDAKTVTLKDTSTQQVLVCDNRHYLKLICSNQQMEFSISNSGPNENQARFRLAQTIATRQGAWIQYLFNNYSQFSKN
jgi:hypothetical protein